MTRRYQAVAVLLLAVSLAGCCHKGIAVRGARLQGGREVVGHCNDDDSCNWRRRPNQGEVWVFDDSAGNGWGNCSQVGLGEHHVSGISALRVGRRTKATLCRNFDGSGGCAASFENRDVECMTVFYVGDDANDFDYVNVQLLP